MPLFRSAPGSTARLIQYAVFYFLFYFVFAVSVKYFQGAKADGFPGLTELEFLVYSTYGSAIVCLGAIFLLGWLRFEWRAKEVLFMMLSGVCTALVIPTTTLMYSLPVSVMVAMVIMRGSVIVISRIVDSILIHMGLSKKKVRMEENVAVLVAILAVSLNLFFSDERDFDFLGSRTAVTILAIYIASYAVRIFIMNYFKFTRSAAATANNKNYFAVEQISASVIIIGFSLLVAFAPQLFLGVPESARGGLEYFYGVMVDPHPMWFWAAVFGIPFGFSAFFSVFLFMFEGRTSTFAGLVNRLSSLLAGTAATLAFALFFGGKWPRTVDWISYSLILLSVYFLGSAELKAKKNAEIKPR